MADIVELMAFADQRIKNNDIEFNERVDVALALLKSLGILSHQLASLTCMTHRLFCGAIVTAYDNKVTLKCTADAKVIYSSGATADG
jgi:hypothetical protein